MDEVAFRKVQKVHVDDDDDAIPGTFESFGFVITASATTDRGWIVAKGGGEWQRTGIEELDPRDGGGGGRAPATGVESGLFAAGDGLASGR